MIRKLFFFNLCLIFLLFFFVKSTQAAYFQLDPTTINVNAGETFTVKININTDGEEVNSNDIYLNFDSSLIEVQQVTAGSFFPTVTNDISAGTVYIAAMVDDPASSKNGSGEVATIKFKALSNGIGEITVNCNQSLIVKADVYATNILNCSLSNKSTITIEGGGGDSPDNNSSPNNSPSSSPASLPKSGIFDNVKNFGVTGLALFFIGIMGKILLKY